MVDNPMMQPAQKKANDGPLRPAVPAGANLTNAHTHTGGMVPPRHFAGGTSDVPAPAAPAPPLPPPKSRGTAFEPGGLFGPSAPHQMMRGSAPDSPIAEGLTMALHNARAAHATAAVNNYVAGHAATAPAPAPASDPAPAPGNTQNLDGYFNAEYGAGTPANLYGNPGPLVHSAGGNGSTASMATPHGGPALSSRDQFIQAFQNMPRGQVMQMLSLLHPPAMHDQTMQMALANERNRQAHGADDAVGKWLRMITTGSNYIYGQQGEQQGEQQQPAAPGMVDGADPSAMYYAQTGK